MSKGSPLNRTSGSDYSLADQPEVSFSPILGKKKRTRNRCEPAFFLSEDCQVWWMISKLGRLKSGSDADGCTSTRCCCCFWVAPSWGWLPSVCLATGGKRPSLVWQYLHWASASCLSPSQIVVKQMEIFSTVADKYLESPMKGALLGKILPAADTWRVSWEEGTLRRVHFVRQTLEALSEIFRLQTDIWRALWKELSQEISYCRQTVGETPWRGSLKRFHFANGHLESPVKGLSQDLFIFPFKSVWLVPRR